MKKEVAESWINALRSEKYVQGQRRLRTKNNTFCCLGVLTDLAVNEGICEWKDPGTSESYDCYTVKSEGAILPLAVADWAGMRTQHGLLSTTSPLDTFPSTNLIRLNDEGKSFAEIADVIEANWERL